MSEILWIVLTLRRGFFSTVNTLGPHMNCGWVGPWEAEPQMQGRSTPNPFDVEVKCNVVLNFKLRELTASFHILRFSLYFHGFVVFRIPGVAFVKFILKCFILFDAIVNGVL